MDALLSTYASSDDEEPPQQPPPSKPLFSTLPKPSLSSSTKDPTSSTKPSSLFSLLPPPNTHFTPTLPPKRVVQFHPPLPLKDPAFRPDDDDEDEDEFDRKKRKQLNNNNININNTSSVKSFLSSIPAPKNSGFGSGLSGSQGSRISVTAPASPSPLPDTPVPAPAPAPIIVDDYNVEGTHVNFDNGLNSYGYEAPIEGNYEGYDQGYYGNESSVTASSEIDRFVSMSGGGGRRRKEQMPTNIVEVKQDELMKNRPTQDKSKLTGIAFGPSYQPVSAKGKPSKLHKRKHQISALYYDMKQKEPEFAERRAKGFLTKSETQAKYGW